MAELLSALETSGTSAAPARELGAPWPRWSDRSVEGWGGPEAWSRWARLLLAEVAAADAEGSPLRRVQLALLAKDQERGGDAWRHLLAAGRSPLVRTALPALAPGVPLETLYADGGVGALADDVLLSPALPPAVHGGRDVLGAFVGREVNVRALRIGEASFDLRILVEGDGVQVDLEHRAGPPARLRVLPPLPPEVEIGLLYADWTKVATRREEVPFTLAGDDPSHTLWARFRGLRDPWPSPPPEDSSAALAAGTTIVVVVREERLQDAFFLGFTEAVGRVFDRSCVVRDRAGARRLAGQELLAPIAIHLDDEAGLERKLVGMLSVLEAHALAGAGSR